MLRNVILGSIDIIFPFFRRLFPNFSVMSELDSIALILNRRLSCVRFGDGEFNIIHSNGGIGTKYQAGNSLLAKKLLDVLDATGKKDLLLCVPIFLSKDVDWSIYEKTSRRFWRYYVLRNIGWISKILSKSYLYGSAQISRPYINRANHIGSKRLFDAWKKVFYDRDIVIVEGEFTRFGVGNDLLKHASSIKRIICPNFQAFSCYEKILSRCLCQNDGSLFILALGPASKPLVLDLLSAGNKNYQVLDLGHLDVEYEWFLRNVNTKVSIPGKYVNESDNSKLSDDIDLKQYQTEIVDKVFPDTY